MSNLTQKIGYRLMAFAMAIFMFVGMLPASAIVYAVEGTENEAYKAKNFTAVYNAETDSIDMTWDAFETEPYELWLCINTVKHTQLDATATSYSFPVNSGGYIDFGIVAYVDEDDSEGVFSDKISVYSAYTFDSVVPFDAVAVDNNLTIAEIVGLLPNEAYVFISDLSGLKDDGHGVQWNTESANYDQTKSEEQTITIPGVVVLDKNSVQNRNNLSLDCSITVNVKAAVDVSITSDLDDSAPVEKKVGESLALSVEANGTAPKYQWHKKTAEETEGTAIDGATSATFTISSLALTDAAQYFCVVTGKNETTATSKVTTINVVKNTTSVDLSIDPVGGQTRPQSVTLEAIGIPDDATGKVIFKEGENLIKEIILPNAEKTATFKAYGANNDYDFTVIYEAGEDNVKYRGSEKTINGYGFDKADQTVAFKVDTVPTEDLTYSQSANFTVEAEGSQTNLTTQYEYAIVDEKDADGDTVSNFVASINKDTGEVTVLAAGSFKITVKALSDDDYNESPVVTSDEINVKRAEQGEFKFETGDATTTYTHDFAYDRELAATGTGNGAITYELGGATTARGVTVDENTGVITFIDAANDNSTSFDGEVGVVEVVATKAKDKWVKEKKASYTITIEKADQSLFEFDIANKGNAPAITYTANEGTTFLNAISTNNDKNGWVNVNNAPVYSIASESALPGDAVATASNVVSINSESGRITAKRSGVVTIKATLAGNGVYNAVDTTYTITINRGTVETATNGDGEATGFNFDLADSSIKYGFNGFVNVAAGGQSDTNHKVVYTDNSDEIDVSENGVISFADKPADAETETYTVTVTATKPETEKYLECAISYTLTVTRDAVDPEKDFKVNDARIKEASKLTSHDGWYNADHDKITIAPDGTKYKEISKDGVTWNESIVIDVDGEHDLAFFLREDDGSTSIVSKQTVNYDTTTATVDEKMGENENFWSKFLQTITFGLYHNDDVELTVTAKDALSGIYSIAYYEDVNPSVSYDTVSGIESANLAWNECQITETEKGAKELTKMINISVDAGKNKKSVVYIKVVDCAGNVDYYVSSGMILDKVDPKQETELPTPIVKIELDNNTNEGLYNGEVGFKLTVNDAQTDAVASGIKDITITIKGSAAENYNKEIKVTAKNSEISSFDSSNVNTAEFDVVGTFTVPADFDSNYITINVVVHDYAGNTYDNVVPANLAIDVTKPAIKVTYNDKEDTFSNGKYIGNNKNRIATIDITELNFDNSAVVLTVAQDGKALDIKPNFAPVAGATDENGDQIGWRMQIDYATLGEGEFTFDIAYTDKALNHNVGWDGDSAAVNKNFIIDNKKPEISVVISNSDVENEKYFAANRTATVTIVERNFSEEYKFDWSGLTLTLDGVTQKAPVPVIKSSNDGTYERVYTIEFSAEGDYTFDVKYTDLADNVADTYTCNSVSYKEFTVDKTAPSLKITGVADKSANNGDVAPVITYSDTNFNKNAVTITLSGVNNGKDLKYAGSYADITHGQTYTYANFEKVQSVDDIYTLTAKLTDMAGNETEATITFSANRFGSVYNLTGLEDILTKYLQTEEDIVFTETNVDSLEREGIKIKLTKNGTPSDLVEGTDYTVEVTGGNGEWSVYTYTIKKALFADDGRYSIAIYSKDAAGNVNENIDETKAAEISFGIDKTNPVIVPIDLESGVQYAVDMKTVSIEIKDNLVLEGVKIYLNGKEVEYTVNGETYTFDIPKSNSKQDVKIVAVDAAGNEEPVEITEFLVNANIFVRWYNNTPLFVGSIIGVVALALGVTGFMVFGKKKKEK